VTEETPIHDCLRRRAFRRPREVDPVHLLTAPMKKRSRSRSCWTPAH